LLLNCHSHFSYRYGTIPIDELLSLAKQNGYTSIALTDINNTSACIEFARLAAEYGIKPVVGVDFRNGVQQQFIAIARNNAGFREINEFLSKHLHGGEAIPGIAAPDHGVALPRQVGRGNDRYFGENVIVIYPLSNAPEQLCDNEFIAVKPKDLVRLKFSPSFWRGIKGEADLVMLSPVSFHSNSPGGRQEALMRDFNCHRLLRAIENNTLMSKLPASELGSPDEVMMHRDELLETFSPPAGGAGGDMIRNTEQLLDQCSIDFDFGVNKNKKSFTDSVQQDYELLRKLCGDNVLYRYPEPSQEVLSRIEKELTTICDLGFSSYFLINWDLVNYARHKGYYYVGRGSGANSIVAYLLRITDVDPVELDLYFERFINPYRTSPPDFDIDFSWMDRDDVTRYLFERHGKEHTALVGAYSTFQYKAVTRELGKVFGLPAREIDKLQRTGDLGVSTDLRVSPMSDTRMSIGSTRQAGPGTGEHNLTGLVLRYARYLHEMPSHITVHSSGILISDKPISAYTATILPPKGYPTTHFSMLEAEDIGLYKFDILGQRGLGKIKDTLEIITKNHPGTELPDIHNVTPFKKDEKVKTMLRNGQAIGCFYVESPAMRMLLKKLKADTYLGLVAASSIIRPGVARSGMMREYIARFRDVERRKKAREELPELYDILHETFGVMVYQEDVLKVAHYFAGLTLAEADVMRRGMSWKFKQRNDFNTVKDKFFSNCHAKGYSDKVISEVWRQIESFANYAFAKGHSASYAVESYQALWLKAYYPLEYMVATVNNGGGYYSAELYLHEARLHGAVVMAPCVNRSDALTTIVGKTIFLGFGLMKDLEVETIRAILKARGSLSEEDRHPEHVSGSETLSQEGMLKQVQHDALKEEFAPFADLSDFVSRVPISLEQLCILIRIGAFRFTGKTKKALLWEAHFLLGPSKKTHPLLFDNPPKQFTLPQLYHYELQDAFDELEILGFALCSPYELMRESSDTHLGVSNTERDSGSNGTRGSSTPRGQDSPGAVLLASDFPHFLNKRIQITAYLVNIKYTSTHDGKRMYFGTFLDLEGQWVDTVHFPPVARQYPFTGPGCYRILGKVTSEFGCYSIEVSKIEKLPLRSQDDIPPKLSVPNNYSGRYGPGQT
jgi:DNA polymerase-3 subunit alpha